MTTAAWLAIGGWFVVTVLLGGVALRTLRLPKNDLLRDWSTQFVAGQLVWLLLTLLTAFTPLPWSALLAIALGLAGLEAVMAVRRAGIAPAGRAVLVVIGSLLVIAALFPNLAALVHCTPAIETDARSIWLFHGKALFFDGGIDPRFFADPLLYWSSPDYPLLLPAQTAWSSTFLGRWDEFGSRAWLWFLFAAWCRLLFVVLVRRGLPWWLGVALVFVFGCFGISFHTVGFAYVSGQADYHCSLPLLLAMLVLGTPRTAVPAETAAGHAPFVALMLASTAATKSEGTIYALLFAAALLGWHGLVALRRGGLRGPFAVAAGQRSTWLVTAVFGLLPWFLWARFKAAHGMGSNLKLFERATTPGLLQELLSTRLPTVLDTMWNDPQLQQTKWWLVALAVLAAVSLLLRAIGARGAGLRACEPVQAAAWLAVLALIATTYVLTPHDYVYHMTTSLTRLLFLPTQMVFVLVVFRLDALRRASFAR
jgi:hypothetical protein